MKKRPSLAGLDVALPDPSALAGSATPPPEISAAEISRPLNADTSPTGSGPGSPVAEIPVAASRPTSAEKPASPVTRPPAPLERKEVFLRPSQRDQLSALEARLRRQRPSGVGERLTTNTLIRVAIDLLLTKEDLLAGHTEDELRRSVGVVTWRH